MVIKDTSFGVKYQNILVGRHIINYEKMFMGTPIYIRYVVINVILITCMLAIELFYLTQFHSFLGCLFEYLPLFIPYRFAVFI